MGNLLKKKDIEPIKKIKIKMACDCGYVSCFCDCVATESTRYDTTAREHGSLSAKMCSDMNTEKKGPPSA